MSSDSVVHNKQCQTSTLKLTKTNLAEERSMTDLNDSIALWLKSPSNAISVIRSLQDMYVLYMMHCGFIIHFTVTQQVEPRWAD